MRTVFSAFYLTFLFHAVAAQAAPDVVIGRFVDATAQSHGSITFKQHGDMLLGTVKISGVEPGLHAMHIHTTGQCRGDGFTTAGGHWNPDGKQHGLQNTMGAHKGDLPQIMIGKNGKGRARFVLRSSLALMLDVDGAALIIHANADDGITDPSGNSGPRIFCAVIEQH